MSKTSAVIAAMLLALTLSACKKEGPAEKAGKEIDKAMEKAADAVEEATKSK
jgi:hypothetical protein